MRKLLIALFLSTIAHAQSVQQSIDQLGTTGNWVLTFRWTGSGSGSVPSTPSALGGCCQGYLITQVETVPGTPSPTSGYSVAITDAAGVDVLAGAGAALSSTTPQAFAAASSAAPLQGALNLVITGQNVAVAKGAVYVFLSKPGTVNLAKLNGGSAASSPNWLTIANAPFLDARRYNFSPQSPGGSLSAGSNTVNIRPGVAGLSGTDVAHYLYISGGTGTAEACLITGGTATSGVAGTIVMTCANTHSGAWTISSVASGIPEALYAASGDGMVYVAAGAVTVHGPIYLPLSESLVGADMSLATLNVAADFPLTATGVFTAQPGGGFGIAVSDLSIGFIQPDSTNIADYTHWPPAFGFASSTGYTNYGAGRFRLSRINVYGAWDVIDERGNTAPIVTDFYASMFHYGIQIDGSLDTSYFTRVKFWPYGMTANQQTVWLGNSSIYAMRVGRSDDLRITDFFSNCYHGIYFYEGTTTSSATFPAKLENIHLDQRSDLQVTCGTVDISNLSITLDSPGEKPLMTVNEGGCVIGPTFSGTTVRVSGALFFPGPTPTGTSPFLSVTGGNLQMTNGWFWTSAADIASVVESGATTILQLADSLFIRTSNTAYTVPTINITAGAAILQGNFTKAKGTGAGTFISVTSDDYHKITGNTFAGWSSSFPAVTANSLGVYEDDANSYFRAITRSNYINVTGGGANAVTGNLPGTALVDGLEVNMLLGVSLRAGANTFNYNGLGALAIVQESDGSNLSRAYASGGRITLHYDGPNTRWMAVGQ